MDIQKLLTTQKTVFTVQQIGQILGITNAITLRRKISRWGKQGFLQHLHYGIRALSHYSEKELANALKTPSYISLETVLYQEAVVFQYYGNTIFSLSNNTITFTIGDITYEYHKISEKILLNPKGIVYQDGIAIASKERAICDRLYLSPRYYFDHLDDVNWKKLLDIAEIYQNKRLLLDIIQLRNGIKHSKT
jgi:hypothetical protein